MATAVENQLNIPTAHEPTIEELAALAAGEHPQALRITITPALAAALLLRNRHNRNLRESAVSDYVRDILSGGWPLNGETLKFSKQLDTLDGQHRLHAIRKAGMPVETFVIVGLPPETQATMDAGMRRTTADAFSLQKEAHAIVLSSVTKRVWAWEQGDRKFARRSTATTTECRALLEKHPELRRSAEIAVQTRAAFPHIPQSALGTAHFLFNRIDPALTPEFFARIGDGAELPKGHPILALRSRVTTDRQKTEGRIQFVYYMAFLVFTWNAVREDRPLTKIQVKKPMVPNPK